MKLFIFSDLHFREFSPFISYNAVSQNGYTREIENFLRGCQFLANSIRETRPDIVFNLGDTIHLPTGLSLKLLSAMDTGLGWIEEECRKQGVELIHLIGNHDIFSEETKIDLSPFFHHRYGTCYNEPFSLSFKGQDFSLIPYTSDIEFMTRELLRSKGSIILTHNEFVGAQYDNGQFTPSLLEKKTKDVVISGHIHRPQEAGGVIYCGSVLSVKFDRLDTTVPLGAMLYDTEMNTYSRIQNNLSSHYIKLSSTEELQSLPSKNYIVKLYTRERKQDIEEVIKGWELLYIKRPEQRDTVKTTIVNAKSSKDSLRDYIEAERPDALEIFDRYSKGYSHDPV